MSAGALIWLAIASLAATSLAAVGARSLAEFSRHELEEICRRRGSPERLGQILRGYEQAGLSAEMAVVIATAAFVSAVAYWLISGQSAQPGWPPWAMSVALASVALLVATIWTAAGIARIWAEPLLYFTWPLWQGLVVVMTPLVIGSRMTDTVLHRLAGRVAEEPDEESFEDEIRTIVTEGHREGLLEVGPVVQDHVNGQGVGKFGVGPNQQVGAADAADVDPCRQFAAGHQAQVFQPGPGALVAGQGIEVVVTGGPAALEAGEEFATRFPDVERHAKRLVVHIRLSLHQHRRYPRRRVILLRAFENRLRQATRIITVSEHARGEIVELLGVSEEKVTVTYEGAGSQYKPLSISWEKQVEFQAKYNLPERFLLYVGTIEPRKNLERLIEAYYVYKREEPNSELKLVLAGGKGWLYEGICTRVQELHLEQDIVFTGYVDGEDLPFLYNMAIAFVYPSLYEGFGLPPLEAMSCGTPVISSNTSSIPEVVGEAGILIDPYQVNDLAAAIYKVAGSLSLQDELSRKGLERAQLFSWKKCAEETLQVYRECMQE